MAAAAIGTDTGGSIRIPAALNGLVGFKPTARRVPLDGVLPLSFTLDSAGPIAKTVADCALLDQVLAARRVTVEGRDVRLTPTEWRLLEVLVRHPGELLSQRTLLAAEVNVVRATSLTLRNIGVSDIGPLAEAGRPVCHLCNQRAVA